MTDRQKLEAYLQEQWFRTQLSKLEELVYDYETGEKTFEEINYQLGFEKGYLKRKYKDGEITYAQHVEYENAWKDNAEYVHELEKIREEM